jgi:hypothetical protein
MRGGGGCFGVSAYEYSCAYGAHINFGDLTPYLIYTVSTWQPWHLSSNNKQQNLTETNENKTNNTQPTANNRQPTTDSQQPTANNR